MESQSSFFFFSHISADFDVSPFAASTDHDTALAAAHADTTASLVAAVFLAAAAVPYGDLTSLAAAVVADLAAAAAAAIAATSLASMGWGAQELTDRQSPQRGLGAPRRCHPLPPPLPGALGPTIISPPSLVAVPAEMKKARGACDSVCTFQLSLEPAPSPPWRHSPPGARLARPDRASAPLARRRSAPWPKSSRKRPRLLPLAHPFSCEVVRTVYADKTLGCASTSTIIPCRPRPWAVL